MGLTSWSRGSVLGVFALSVILLAVSLQSPSNSGAAEIVDRGAPRPEVSKPDKSLASRSPLYASPASADAYWTPERMEAAKPADNTPAASSLDLPDFGADATTSAATGDFTPTNVDAFPQRIQGKIFFRVNGNDYTCSGTVVESAKKNVVFTAGHCVYDQTYGYVSQLIFVPGYASGTTKYKVYNATFVYTTTPWINSGTNSYDIGVVSLDQPIQNALGARQIAFNPEPSRGKYYPAGNEYTIFGYPSKPSQLFDGETLRGCRVAIDGFDTSPPNVVPYPMAANPCLMQQGASGGGWITLGNYLNSVVSYGYCDNIASTCGTIFGPYFSGAAKGLYALAGGSPAPTVKVISAPPRIVKKRRVSFRFGGSAATLISFVCKLDAQKPVGCSSKISINNLRQGKHTLRVRSIDQTGKLSRKQVVKTFRVALRKR